MGVEQGTSPAPVSARPEAGSAADDAGAPPGERSPGGSSASKRRRPIDALGRRARSHDADWWVMVGGCVASVLIVIWLTWGIWQPGVPKGDDTAGHLMRTEYAMRHIFSAGRLDGWQSTFGLGWEQFLFYGPGFNLAVALIKVASFGSLSTLAAFKLTIVASLAATPLGVAFVAWAFGLGRRAAGIAAVLSLCVSSPMGGAGLAGVFSAGLLPHQFGGVFLCASLGGVVLLVRRPSPRRVVFTAAALALLMISHPISALVLACLVGSAVVGGVIEWLASRQLPLVDGPGADPITYPTDEDGGTARPLEAEPIGEAVARAARSPKASKSGQARHHCPSRRRQAARIRTRGAYPRNLFAWRPRLVALVAAGALGVGLGAVTLVPLVAHRDLKGGYTGYPQATLLQRLTKIWKGEFLLRPLVAALALAGMVYLMRHARRRPLAVTMVLSPFVFLAGSRLFARLAPTNIVGTQLLANRAVGSMGFLLLLPLAAALAAIGSRAVRDRSRAMPSRVLSGVAPILLAIAVVILPPELGRGEVGTVHPTPAMAEAARVIHRVVPTGHRFATQRAYPQEIDLAGMSHPDFWVAWASGRDTLSVFTPEASNVYGPTYLNEHLGTLAPSIEAAELARLGISHVLLIDSAKAESLLDAPQSFRVVWKRSTMTILQVLPGPGQPDPSSLLSTQLPSNGRLVGAGYEHYRVDASTGRSTTASIAVAYSPKWRVTIDGHAVSTGQTQDHLLRIRLPAGESVIDLRYHRDVWNLLGSILTVVSAAVAAAIVLRERRRLRA